ncbi:MAG: hypothetical protein GF331_00300 [Chitinivibrionales bacterium]|nr:hypothetical protein [Chitinivibrionales bacterium]
MKWGRAFWAGVLGGAIMTILVAIARTMGMPVNLSMMLGTLIGVTPSVGAWVLGFIIHLVISGLIAWLYAAGFEYATHRANAGIGAAFAIVHTILGGLFLGILPAIHPLMPDVIPAPGIFLSNLGVAGVVTFILLHLIYGVIVGGAYGVVLHRPARREVHAPAR